MSQTESRLSRDIMGELRLRGWFCFKVHGSEHMMAGLPDIIVCAEGVFVGLEVKMPSKRSNLSSIQRRVRSKIIEAGGSSEVVCSVSEALAAVADAIDQSRNLGAAKTAFSE